MSRRENTVVSVQIASARLVFAGCDGNEATDIGIKAENKVADQHAASIDRKLRLRGDLVVGDSGAVVSRQRISRASGAACPGKLLHCHRAGI